MLSAGLSVPVGWYDLATLLGALGFGYSGVITNIMDDPKDNTFRLLLEYVIYSYKDSWTSHKTIGWAGTGPSSEIFNDPMNIASGEKSHAEGNSTTAEGDYSHAEGDYSHAEGYSSHAEGYSSHAEGDYSHAEGRSSHAEGYSSHAEGNSSHAEGNSSHAEGGYSHAEGYFSHAEGGYSHAEGYSSHAEGNSSHAEGYSSHAEGGYSHAEGNSSHAEGYSSHAEGYSSHAEGHGDYLLYDITGEANAKTYSLTSTNNLQYLIIGASVRNTVYIDGVPTYSTAKIVSIDKNNLIITLNRTLSEDTALNNTQVLIYYSGMALGDNSHSEGNQTIAAGRSQHTQGEFNVVDPEYDVNNTNKRAKYAHIVGNGTSQNNRSNAHTLDWDGNAWYQGEVYVGGTSQDDENAVKLAKVTDIPEAIEQWMTENPGQGGEVEIPETLPNPNKLTFTGAVTAEYDGSAEVTVEIPEIPEIPESIPIPETAEVGQTIVVKAVDENGKPTEWECADRTHWVEQGMVEVLAECQPPYIESEGFMITEGVPTLSVGETYIVNWNGVEYTCIGQDASNFLAGAVLLGDGSPLGLVANGEPFTAVCGTDEEGSVFMIQPMDGSTELTLSIMGMGEVVHHLDPKYIKDMYYTEDGGMVEILPETTLTTTENNLGEFYIEENPPVLVAGNTYIVNWNGTEYTCTAQDLTALMAGAVGLGDMYTFTDGAFGTAATGEPYVLIYAPVMGFSAQAIKATEELSLTLSIHQSGEIVHKIQNKYLDLDWLPVTEKLEATILPMGEFDCSVSEGNYYKYMTNAELSLVGGRKYKVFWDGSYYDCICTAQRNESMGIDFYYLGNRRLMVGNWVDTGEPFCFYSVPAGPMLQIHAKTQGVHTAAIVENDVAPNKLPKHFLPDSVGFVTANIVISSSLNSATVDVPYAALVAAHKAGKFIRGVATVENSSDNAEFVFYLNGLDAEKVGLADLGSTMNLYIYADGTVSLIAGQN